MTSVREDAKTVSKEPDTAGAESGEASQAFADAVARANSAIEAIGNDYRQRLIDDGKQLRKLLDEAEQSDDRGEIFQSIFEVTHNIKGQAGSFGYALLTKLGASLCDYLRAGDHTDNDALQIVRHHVTTITSVIDEDIQGDGGELGTQLMGRLHALSEPD